MIGIVNCTHKSTPYLEPHNAEILCGRLSELGFDSELIDTSIADANSASFLDQLLATHLIVFLGILNVRGVLDENQQLRNRISQSLRRRGYRGTILAAGHHATLSPRRTLEDCPSIDAVVIGEPEQVVPSVLAVLDTGGELSGLPGLAVRQKDGVAISSPVRAPRRIQIAPSRRPYLEQLLESHPAAFLAALIETSRGCYHPGCSFCTTPSFYRAANARGFRLKSVEDVLDEIESVVDRYGVRRFVFEDDSFCSPGAAGARRLAALRNALTVRDLRIEFSMLIRADTVNERTAHLFEDLKDLGLRLVYLGLESFDEADLAFYTKGIPVEDSLVGIRILNGLGYSMDVAEHFRVKPGFLPFHPFTRLEQIRGQMSLWRTNRLTPVKMLARVEVYPGTPLYETTEAAGLLDPGTRSGFAFRHKETEIFHSIAREGLKVIYRPRRRIREIEKAQMGFGLRETLTADVRRCRELIEDAFYAFYSRALDAVIEEGTTQSAGLMDGLHDDLDAIEAEVGIEAMTEKAWRAVLIELRSIYAKAGKALPEDPDPVYFRPCFFPVIH